MILSFDHIVQAVTDPQDPGEVCPAEGRALSWPSLFWTPQVSEQTQGKTMLPPWNYRGGTNNDCMTGCTSRAMENAETTRVYTDGSRKVNNAISKFSLWSFDLSSSPNCRFPLQEELRLRSWDTLQLSWVSSCWYHCSSMKDRISGVPTMILSYSHKNKNLSPIASCSVLLPQGTWRKGRKSRKEMRSSLLGSWTGKNEKSGTRHQSLKNMVSQAGFFKKVHYFKYSEFSATHAPVKLSTKMCTKS